MAYDKGDGTGLHFDKFDYMTSNSMRKATIISFALPHVQLHKAVFIADFIVHNKLYVGAKETDLKSMVEKIIWYCDKHEDLTDFTAFIKSVHDFEDKRRVIN